jgi:peptidoglycan/LPS O-acetylase OafA/YrhL
LAILLITFSSYQAVIWVISILAVASLLIFNRSGEYEDYFIYFIGAYSLGVLAYLSKCFQNQGVNRVAKISLVLIGLVIAISSFQQIWLRNYLAWVVAILLLFWGSAPYPEGTQDKAFGKAISWGSKRSYCTFLIHFAFILLANTLYIALGLNEYESGTLAIGLMLAVVVCSVIAANYLYRWIEVPSVRLKV